MIQGFDQRQFIIHGYSNPQPDGMHFKQNMAYLLFIFKEKKILKLILKIDFVFTIFCSAFQKPKPSVTKICAFSSFIVI